MALGRVDASRSDLDAAELAALRDAIAKSSINVAIDPQAQCSQVLDFAALLDAMALDATTTAAAK